ncbi:MAG: hypothetical protein R8G66_25685 [Cytophagales bacterium]|nr:hypothetical protein [Cytophagales bacterium]
MRSWREIRVMMKWRFANLDDADFEIVNGDKERTLDQLASKLQKTRVELERIIAELQHC